MDLVVAQMNGWIVPLSVALGMLVTWRIGLWMGQTARREARATAPSKFDDASLALLGLLLAFTFGVSISKHDQRRLAVVADSNAIGDFYTCASLIKEPTRTKLQTVIREYAELLLALGHSRQITEAQLNAALDNFQHLQRQMTDLVAQALTEGTPIAVSLTNTLNEVTSSHAARLAAVRDRLPGSIVLLLMVASIVTCLLIGREQGLAAAQEMAGTLCFILLVSLAVWVTLDLNQPTRGMIVISQEPLERLVASMGK
jgi:hypothetical protein